MSESLAEMMAREDRETDARETMERDIEQFENEQRDANQWISFHRIAEWLAGHGVETLAAAYMQLRGDLRGGRFHKTDDPQLKFLLAGIGHGPANPWHPTLEECREFIDTDTFKEYGDLRTAAYFARIIDETRLIGGAWIRRDLATKFLSARDCPLPAWLQDVSGESSGPKFAAIGEATMTRQVCHWPTVPLSELLGREPHWNLGQFLLWVGTRDAGVVAAASDRKPYLPKTIGLSAALITESRLQDGIDPPDAREQWIADAIAALAAGRVAASGIPNSATAPRKIDPDSEWSHLDIAFEWAGGTAYVRWRRGDANSYPAFDDVAVCAADAVQEFPPPTSKAIVAAKKRSTTKLAAIGEAVDDLYPNGVPQSESIKVRDGKIIDWIRANRGGIGVSDRTIREWFRTRAAA